MAKRIEHDRFLIIECTAKELTEACGSSGICDWCGEPKQTGFYIAVLNQWFCPECFEEWKLTAHYYHEDIDVERRNFEFYGTRLGINVSKC